MQDFFLHYLCAMRIIVIDAGNTSIKLGSYEDTELRSAQRFGHNEIELLLNYIESQKPSKVVISSVISDAISKRIVDKYDAMIVDHGTPIPISNCYGSPQTLGMDRLCNAVAIAALMQTDYAVSIDIGTCIKFDLVGKKEGYIGGSIAPGIDLRYRSLNEYTEKLPLLSNKSATSLVGKNTETSIRSGVINGINSEIAGFVSQYESDFSGLTFFVTGGDSSYFDIQSKNDIFADENLTLRGLFEIYRHNA